MKKLIFFFQNLLSSAFSNKAMNRLILNLSLILSIFYLVVRFIDNFFLQIHGIGDEFYFIRDLSFFLKNGYYKSVLNGISIPTSLISGLLYQLTNHISYSLRLANTFIVFLLIFYLLKREGLVDDDLRQFFTIFLFMLIGTMGGMFSGTNDSIFNASLLIVFSELYLALKNNKTNNIYMVIGFTICMLSRPIFLIYLPVTFLSLIIFNWFKDSRIEKSIFYSIYFNFFTSLILVVLFNYPKVLESNLLQVKNNHLTMFIPFFLYRQV